jgi:hypothetical protein
MGVFYEIVPACQGLFITFSGVGLRDFSGDALSTPSSYMRSRHQWSAASSQAHNVVQAAIAICCVAMICIIDSDMFRQGE